LCDILSLECKTSPYKPEFHKPSLFNNKSLLNEFIAYSLQDSEALYNCIKVLQGQYISDFNVDITTTLSTSSLSLKIFRQKLLDLDNSNFHRPVDGFY
jgi:hypothetical protein